MNQALLSVAALTSLAVLSTAVAQAPAERPAPPPVTLSVGDPAPAFAPEVWVKGEAFDSFAEGKVHVVEFWATWCGPCIAAMPHLTELQKKYPEVVIVGIAASESRPKEGAPDERLPYLRGFVRGKGDVIGYRVAYASDRTLWNDWMAAAGRTGIPSSFIVGRDGNIEWMGHPMAMDKPLEQVVSGSWNRDAEAAKSRKDALIRRKNAEIAPKVAAAMAASNWDEALSLYDQMLAEVPDHAPTMVNRFKLLAGKAGRSTEASQYGATLLATLANDPMSLNEVAWFIVDDGSVGTRDLDLAHRLAERGNEVSEGKNPAILDTLARIWWDKGDKAKAVEIQTMAVGALSPSDQTIMAREIRATLKRYQGQ